MTYIELRTSLSVTLRSILPSLRDDPTEDAIATALLHCCQQWGIVTESELLLLLASDAAFVRRRLRTALAQEHRQQTIWHPADVQKVIDKVLLALSTHHISQKTPSTLIKVEKESYFSLTSMSVADMLLPAANTKGSSLTSSVHNGPRFFTTGCPSLDVLLAGVGSGACGRDSNRIAIEGGFRAGLLTEVYGEAGSGKTQLVLQCLLHCIARQQCEQCNPDTSHKDCADDFKRGVAALYIVSEDFPATRLSSLAAGALKREKERVIHKISHFPSSTIDRFKLHLDATITVRSVMTGMHIRRITSLKDLLQMLRGGTLSTAFQTLGDRGVVVVDSIAGAAVATTTATDDVDGIGLVPSSSAELLTVGSLLKAFAVQRGAAVVVTNQVRAQLSSPTAVAFCTTCTSSAAVVPALGLAWALAPHVRVQLRRSATAAGAVGTAPVGAHALSAAERRLTVLAGPAHPPVCGVYTITTDGIRCDS